MSSTATGQHSGAAPDVDPRLTDAPIAFRTLVLVELRKLLDTRSGRWFSAAIGALVVAGLVLAVVAFPEGEQEYAAMLSLAGGVIGYFVPVLVILLVTSEWSQRTALGTFTLEPRRSRVVGAKLATGVVVTVVALVAAALLAALATAGALGTGGSAWDVGWAQVQSFAVGNLLLVLVGFALAVLLRSTPAAIVGYFAYTLIVPTVAGLLSALVGGLGEVLPWVEFNTAQSPLFSGDYRLDGTEWAQLLVSGTVWLLLPLGLGVARLLRAEVK